MVWYAWVMIGLYVVNALMTTALIGRDKSCSYYRPVDAVMAIIVSSLMIWAVVSLAT